VGLFVVLKGGGYMWFKKHYAELQEDGLDEFLELIAILCAIICAVSVCICVLLSLYEGVSFDTIIFRVFVLSGAILLIYILLRLLSVTILMLLYTWLNMVKDRRSRKNVTIKEITSKEINFDRGHLE
jgi:uncharacterized membrane protein